MKNLIDLSSKNILVTGASQGIGAVVCKELAECGANVIMIARSKDKLMQLKNELGNNCHIYPYDLKDIDGIEKLIKQIVSEVGKLDGFVHCAGIGPTRPLKLSKYDFIHDVMLVNFYSFVEISRVYAMKKNNNGGSIVAISSVGAIRANPAKVAYCASKAAIDGAVRALAVELKPNNIRVNSIQPGWVRTEMFEEYLNTLGDDVKKRFNSEDIYSKNTIIETYEVARTILFLLSDMSSAISGASMLATKVGI